MTTRTAQPRCGLSATCKSGNYLLVDVAQQENGRYPVIDGWHEAWPDPKYCDQIATSFSDFWERALRDGQAYWLNE